jgi:hypothetical protein
VIDVLLALLAMVGAWVVGAVLMGTGHIIIGSAVLIASLPIGLAVWLKRADRF